tara:strand:- start:393 stop:584 length:192 start_codon:yes stop_codon:yes gene_type:complete
MGKMSELDLIRQEIELFEIIESMNLERKEMSKKFKDVDEQDKIDAIEDKKKDYALDNKTCEDE